MYEFSDDIYWTMLDNWETWYISPNGYGAFIGCRVRFV